MVGSGLEGLPAGKSLRVAVVVVVRAGSPDTGLTANLMRSEAWEHEHQRLELRVKCSEIVVKRKVNN